MISLLAALFLTGDVTAQTRLPAGTVIEPIHVSGAASDTDPFIGRQMTRTVFEGRVLSYTDTKEADLVDRNGIVRIIAKKGPLTIETKGRALGTGAAGDEILVMNLESRRTVTAIITGPGTVQVTL
ncbi:flagellar basal body P-ring formation chaperone FlgA [Parvularcula marina]|uniref:flagellar basal body P-ring formation chaperone FlgA n=1 Tax=Parvularcula marina TaxID=2292771 RepID=UPI003516CE0A